MQTSLFPACRLSEDPSDNRRASKPTYRQPADSGVTSTSGATGSVERDERISNFTGTLQ